MLRNFALGLLLLPILAAASPAAESKLINVGEPATKGPMFASAAAGHSEALNLPDAPSSTLAAQRREELAWQESGQRTPITPVNEHSVKLSFDGHAALHLSSPSRSLPQVCVNILNKGVHPHSTNISPGDESAYSSRGKKAGVAMADRCVSSFLGTLLLPNLFHQSPRYVRMGDTASLWQRAEYSVSQVILTRNLAGNKTLNGSFLLSTLASNVFQDFYHARKRSGFQPTMARFEGALRNRLESNLEQEFLPDLEGYFFRRAAAGFKRIRRHSSHRLESEGFSG